MGELVIGARRAHFPKPDELLRLKIAAMQTHLACCQVRELNGRVPFAASGIYRLPAEQADEGVD